MSAAHTISLADFKEACGIQEAGLRRSFCHLHLGALARHPGPGCPELYSLPTRHFPATTSTRCSDRLRDAPHCRRTAKGSRRMDQRQMTSALFSHSMVECMQTFEL